MPLLRSQVRSERRVHRTSLRTMKKRKEAPTSGINATDNTTCSATGVPHHNHSHVTNSQKKRSTPPAAVLVLGLRWQQSTR
ncbi:hypothetical protein BIW11_12917 [Tropilaelaps mercedesae]|uniref:Uncharacterized protein n=1 Tax=Tropilaelaps mercedesae TaxID=418985 RepID=A0A1V9X4L5_9ACAR|nr:hypothetical protein BIW11_12917 [Tropilaelaps mercedesae]